MNRRSFLSRSFATAGLATASGNEILKDSAAQKYSSFFSNGSDRKDNILFILTDQWTHDVLGYAGHPQVKTPNLDKLAGQSLNFKRAYCPSPACGPSRASLFTGRYPAEHGHMRNADSHFPGLRLFTDRLREQGYKTGLVGKLHLHPMEAEHGFDWKRRMDAHYNTYKEDEAELNDYFDALAKMRPDLSRQEWVAAGSHTEAMGPADSSFWLGERWVDTTAHHTAWTADQSIRFLREEANAEPWFLNASFFGPHHPYTTDFPWADFYKPGDVELPPTWMMKKTSPIFKALKSRISEEMWAWDSSVWSEIIAQYYGYCSQIDHAVGRILNALAERQDADRTWIVFASDHGDHLGNWRLLGKADPYETAIQIPMLVCPPGGLDNPTEHDGVCNLLDLHDTFLDIAGIKSENSKSIIPFFRDGKGENSTFVFQGWAKDSYHACYIEGPRKWIMASRPNGKRLYEMYDVINDPYEMQDLWPTHRHIAEWKTGLDVLETWSNEQEKLLPD